MTFKIVSESMSARDVELRLEGEEVALNLTDEEASSFKELLRSSIYAIVSADCGVAADAGTAEIANTVADVVIKGIEEGQSTERIKLCVSDAANAASFANCAAIGYQAGVLIENLFGADLRVNIIKHTFIVSDVNTNAIADAVISVIDEGACEPEMVNCAANAAANANAAMVGDLAENLYTATMCISGLCGETTENNDF